MTEDIRLIGDGEICFVDIEASADTQRKPRISTNPAYSGGKLDVAWTHPETGERLPVVVDLETLEAGAGLPFVLYHDLHKPIGTIEKIIKTQSDLKAEGSFTHGHTLYGANELTAARNGFKHRPSVTVYRPETKNVVRVGEGERRFINGRSQEGPFFAVYYGKLRNISMESTPGDPDSDHRGSILASSQGVSTMTGLFQQWLGQQAAQTPPLPGGAGHQQNTTPASPPPASTPAPTGTPTMQDIAAAAVAAMATAGTHPANATPPGTVPGTPGMVPGTPPGTPTQTSPGTPAQTSPQTGTPTTPDITAGAGGQTPAPATALPTVPPAPSGQATAPHELDHRPALSKLYERDAISVDIMAMAYDHNWTPAQALKAQEAINKVQLGVGGKPNIAGFPNAPSGKRDEPNGDMIMAAAFLMEQCGFQPDDFDGKKNRDAVLKLDEQTIDAATSGDFRGIRFSDICAHAAESFYNGKMPGHKRRLNSKKPMEYFAACIQAQEQIDRKLDFEYADDIRADADTGLSTIGLTNIWAVINTATIGKAYQEVPTVWQRICKKASVPNFMKHTVHRTKLVGRYERLDRIGGEPPHATYMEDKTETQIDTWGMMLTLSRKDIINDDVGVFKDAAADIGREGARTLERECFAALLTDGAKLFTAPHANFMTGADSAFGFDALDKAFRLFWEQKGMDKELIMVRPSFLLIPTAMYTTAFRLLSMGTMDGSPLGKVTGYQNFPIIDTPYLGTENGLYVKEGSKVVKVPGNDAGWYLFASPTDMPVIVASFLHGKSRPTIERAKMRFSLDGILFLYFCSCYATLGIKVLPGSLAPLCRGVGSPGWGHTKLYLNNDLRKCRQPDIWHVPARQWIRVRTPVGLPSG